MKRLLMLILLSYTHNVAAGYVNFNLKYDTTRGDGIAFETIGRVEGTCAENSLYNGKAPRFYPTQTGTASYEFNFWAGIPRTVELRSAQGDLLQLKISALGMSRTNGSNFGSTGSGTGPHCRVNRGSRYSAIEKAHGELGEVKLSAWLQYSPAFYFIASYEILNNDSVAPGHYAGGFTFANNESKFKIHRDKPIEQISANVQLDIAHVFDVRFPYKAISTDPKNETWREIPVDIRTNEGFKLLYHCKPGGGNDFGVNSDGFCNVAPSGPALAVKLRFPHMGYENEIKPDAWALFNKDDFISNNMASQKRGFIGFKLKDTESAAPGTVYISNPQFIVEADF
ncbi:hypothetical protein [Shewanella sp. YLB-07]|uniref:hypothetical protein n=1 Tax=Shewanella sp. YLB-07 TaxID=2601268 RepID=UPI00128BE630|nr:hypothetical protein [Shewanella sp. YLB-07]MPY24360.1 hypothetical protein [Shewanella sp. YLB-07]